VDVASERGEFLFGLSLALSVVDLRLDSGNTIGVGVDAVVLELLDLFAGSVALATGLDELVV
jgi:hypothetical protein